MDLQLCNPDEISAALGGRGRLVGGEMGPFLTERIRGNISIVRVDPNGAMRVWRLGRDARRALPVHGETILFGAGWSERPSSLLVGRLSTGDTIEDLYPIGGIPDEPEVQVRVIGRGPALHLIQGTRWYLMDIRE